MARHGFSLADIRSLTGEEVRSFVELLAEIASGKTGANSKTYVNHRLKRRR